MVYVRLCDPVTSEWNVCLYIMFYDGVAIVIVVLFRLGLGLTYFKTVGATARRGYIRK